MAGDKNITYEMGGDRFSAPMWATESTLQALVKAMGGTADNSEGVKKLASGLKDFNQTLKDTSKTDSKKSDDLKKAMDDVTDSMDNVKVKLSGESLLQNISKPLAFLLNKGLGLTLLALGTAVSAVTAKFVQLGNNFNELAQSGLALDGQTAQNIARLNLMGMSTAAATKFMLDNSAVMRVMGATVVPQLISQFQNATNQGIDLGMGLGDLTDLLGSELSLRQNLFNVGQMTLPQQRKMAQNIAETSKVQLKYSTALGVSTDAMRDFAAQVLGNNEMLMASMLRLPAQSSEQITKGFQQFISVMRGMGGEVGGEIAAAAVDAASMGAIGFSDAAFGFITVLPGLADNFSDVIEGFNSGMLDGEAVARSFSAELGNLSDGEKQRVFLLARAGDEQAKAMAKAIRQFEQAEKSLAKQGVSTEGLANGFNAFNAVVDKVRGLFSAAFNQFMQGFGEGAGNITDFATNIAQQFAPVMNSLFGMNNAVGGSADKMKKLGKTVAEKLETTIKSFAIFLADTITYLKGFVLGFKGMSFKEIMGDIFGRMTTAIVDGIKNNISWADITLAWLGLIAAIGVTKAGGSLVGSLIGGGAKSVGGGVGLGAAKMGKGMGMGMTSLATGTKALGAIPVPIILKAALAIGVLGAALIPLSYALSLLAPLIESMGKAIGSVLTGLAPTIKAFGTVIESMGKAIASVFNSIGGVIESVGTSIASVMDSITRMKVGKINAEADAMVKTTEASVNAIEKLQHLDPTQILGLAMGVNALGSALGNFAENMSPTMLDSLRGGMAALFGADSPVEQVLALSQNADPVKIMNLAKATMATTAANKGETSLDPSLTTPSSSQNIINNTSNTNNTTTGGSTPDLSDALELLATQNTSQLDAMKKTNKLLAEISGKS